MTPYYAPEGGGLERYADEILAGLVQRDHEVEAMSFTRNGAGVRPQKGVRVARYASRFTLGNTPIDLGFSRRIRRRIHLFRPDVVVAHTPVPFPAEAAYAAARRTKTPFVATYHAGRLRGSRPTLEALAALDRATRERRMLAGAKRLIAVGPYVRDHALADHRERVTVVPPGVDARRFKPNGGPTRPGILFAGPLSRSYRWKGVDVLWDAFPRVRARVPDATLTLIGAGDRLQEFAQKASEFRGAVRVLGRVSEVTLARELSSAAVVTLPSTTDAESFGMVLAEANACGRPVVASRIGGIPDFVEDGVNGLLATPGDPEDLAHKLTALLEDPRAADAMGERGRARVRQRHDWARLVEATERVLKDAVA